MYLLINITPSTQLKMRMKKRLKFSTLKKFYMVLLSYVVGILTVSSLIPYNTDLYITLFKHTSLIMPLHQIFPSIPLFSSLSTANPLTTYEEHKYIFTMKNTNTLSLQK